MVNFVRATYSIDEETLALLERIAERERDPGETPNESRSIRKMIRKTATELGIIVPAPVPESKQTPTPRVASGRRAKSAA